MLVCKKCKTEIMEGTAAAEKLVCIPCSEDRPLFNDESRNIRAFKKRLDGQYIEISRISKSKNYFDYQVTSTIRDMDPRFRSRYIKAGSSTGIIRIYKETGNMEVIYPISLDTNDQNLLKAMSVLSKAFRKGELPEKTCYASG